MSLLRCIVILSISGVLFILDALLLGMYMTSLDVHTGGATEIFCLLVSYSQVLLVATYIIYCVRSRMQQLNKQMILSISSMLVVLSLSGCAAITARAADSPGLLPDFANESSLATAVLVLAWFSLLLSLAMLLDAHLMKVPESLCEPPHSYPHRVMFYGDQEAMQMHPVGISPIPPAYAPPRIQDKSIRPISRAEDQYEKWVDRRLRPLRLSRSVSSDQKWSEAV